LTFTGAVLQYGATGTFGMPSEQLGNPMRSPLKSGLLIHLQQNKAGLIADLAILALFLGLLAVR
jgi:hypothetical protein